VSVLFRKKEWLTLAQLTGAWGLELANAGEADRYIQDLEHILLTDIINGRLDDSGPLREDQRSGLRLITPENKAGIIKGHHVRDLLRTSPISWALNHIVVMKEAALDFARRHELPPPPWWTDGARLSAAGVTTKDAHSVAASLTSTRPHVARPRGRKPKKLDQVKDSMREDIRLGGLTPVALRDMPEKKLADRYGVSRDTARKARDAILPKILPAAAPDRT
jgi:Bacterial regulatory proteins, gntR family